MYTFDIHIRNAALVTLACAFAAVQAWAASQNPDFKAYDQNGDGAISLEEFVEQGGKGQDFLVADVDSDNRLSNEEWIKVSSSKAP